MCQAFINEFVKWLENEERNETRFLHAILTSNQGNGIVRYAKCRLKLITNIKWIPITVLEGEGFLYESNETYSIRDCDDKDNITYSDKPFDAESVDKIKITISVLTGAIVIKSPNKGKAIISNPQCDPNQCVIFGFANDGEGDLGQVFKSPQKGDFPFPYIPVRPYYIISFTTEKQKLT